MRQNKWLWATFISGLILLGAAISQTSNPPALKAAKYSVSESVINFSNQGQKIVATWAIPKGANAPYPTVLLLNGFTSQRQELPIHDSKETMFMRTARLLAEQGYASLRIDFRGSGESISDFTFADTTFSSQISDARAAIEFLSLQPEVDHNRIAILGLSQGGMIGAATAAAESRVKSLILWSPVAIPAKTYSDLLGKETIANGLASKGQGVLIKTYDSYTTLKTAFFQELKRFNPITEIARYNRPLLVVVGRRDDIVTPQPQAGWMYLNSHPGQEKLVVLDADHVFDILGTGPERLDEGIAWSVNWLEQTL